MYCKYCGKHVDRETMKCTSCGKPVGKLSGGNSFMQMIQSDASAQVKVVESNHEIKENHTILVIAEDIDDIKKKITKYRLNYTALISAVSVLLGVITLISLFVIGKKNGRSIKGLDDSANQKLDEINLILEERADDEKQNILINVHPESYLNVTSGSSVTFICGAIGDGLSFTWHKFSADGKDMVVIEPDSPDFQITSGNNESKLMIASAGEEHEGIYYCRVKDNIGNILYSSPSQLFLATNNDANAEEAISIPEGESQTNREKEGFSSDTDEDGLASGEKTDGEKEGKICLYLGTV